MKYLCLGYYDEKKFEALSSHDVDALVSQCKKHDESLRQSGNLLMVASLAATKDSTSIRPKQGEPTVTDGRYAETKEQLGAIFIIEARDLNEAIRVASKHPAARLGEHVGWGIEIRPIEFYDQL